jgi:hypothetical protein
MGRHIVGPFVNVAKTRIAVPRKIGHKCFEIASYTGIRIFADD